jgi:hypothetical protein
VNTMFFTSGVVVALTMAIITNDLPPLMEGGDDTLVDLKFPGYQSYVDAAVASLRAEFLAKAEEIRLAEAESDRLLAQNVSAIQSKMTNELENFLMTTVTITQSGADKLLKQIEVCLSPVFLSRKLFLFVSLINKLCKFVLLSNDIFFFLNFLFLIRTCRMQDNKLRMYSKAPERPNANGLVNCLRTCLKSWQRNSMMSWKVTKARCRRDSSM